jgi:7-carboxy-7-deazaguanine synthase (Cx14CxxC type)
VSYAVKEMFLTLQGEGMQAGRRAVFLRLAGCNLWSGREQDRARAQCTFCDTDFVGTGGENGGRYEPLDLAAGAKALWGEGERPLVVVTGGEPMLQLDEALVAALHDQGFEVAMETNGTLAALPSIDWICVSPKAGTNIVQSSGNELKLVWPAVAAQPADPQVAGPPLGLSRRGSSS